MARRMHVFLRSWNGGCMYHAKIVDDNEMIKDDLAYRPHHGVDITSILNPVIEISGVSSYLFPDFCSRIRRQWRQGHGDRPGSIELIFGPPPGHSGEAPNEHEQKQITALFQEMSR